MDPLRQHPQADKHGTGNAPYGPERFSTGINERQGDDKHDRSHDADNRYNGPRDMPRRPVAVELGLVGSA